MSEEMKAECQLDAEHTTQARLASTDTQSFHSVPFVGLRNTLPSDVDIISPFVEQLMRFISRLRMADGNDVEIEVALREALLNAIVHGNEEDPNKLVYVKCRCTRDGEVSITVENEATEIRIFGESELTIENSNYTLNPSHKFETTSIHFENEARLAR